MHPAAAKYLALESRTKPMPKILNSNNREASFALYLSYIPKGAVHMCDWPTLLA